MDIYELKEEIENCMYSLMGKLDDYTEDHNYETILKLKQENLNYRFENNRLKRLKNEIIKDIQKYCQLYADDNNYWIEENGKKVLKFDGYQQKKYAEMILKKIEDFNRKDVEH